MVLRGVSRSWLAMANSGSTCDTELNQTQDYSAENSHSALSSQAPIAALPSPSTLLSLPKHQLHRPPKPEHSALTSQAPIAPTTQARGRLISPCRMCQLDLLPSSLLTCGLPKQQSQPGCLPTQTSDCEQVAQTASVTKPSLRTATPRSAGCLKIPYSWLPLFGPSQVVC